MNFIDQSPTSYHAVAVMADELRQAGFHPQKEPDPWDVRPGGHYVVRDGAMIAYVIPPQTTSASTAERESVGKNNAKNKNDGGRHPAYRIIGAHTDSPALTLKPTPQSTTSDGWGQLAVEVYGGALLNSWLDRELVCSRASRRRTWRCPSGSDETDRACPAVGHPLRPQGQ